MVIPLNTTTALLVELLHGPGYGLDLIERVRARGAGRIGLRQGVVYPTLRALVRRRLLRSWKIATPGSGRPRTYYELTPRGIALAEEHRETIAAFAAKMMPAPPTRRELKEMGQRLEECFDGSDLGMMLIRAGKTAGR